MRELVRTKESEGKVKERVGQRERNRTEKSVGKCRRVEERFDESIGGVSDKRGQEVLT